LLEGIDWRHPLHSWRPSAAVECVVEIVAEKTSESGAIVIQSICDDDN